MIPEAAVLAAFRRAASTVPAYRRLLAEQGVEPATVVDTTTFIERCPVLTKANTFDRFPIDQLCAEGAMGELAGVLTSSGHGGRFSFGLITRRQHDQEAAMIDYALDAAFEVRSRPTLVINCLPMGVGFSSAVTTVATTSVREDMVTALVRTFGSHYEQVVIVSDPLFFRRVLDYAREQRLDWRRYRINVVLGEELFGEHFRTYAARRLGLDFDRPDTGYIMSSFGVGELGLHLGYETPSTIELRRTAFRDEAIARDLFGDTPVLPMVFAYNAARTMIEDLDPDASGFGRLTISMLDPEAAVPLLRYQTGDVVKLLDRARIERVLRRHEVLLTGTLPDTMFALVGREKEQLPDGSHVTAYKDALYADPRVADRLTGAFRITATETGFVIVHVQLVRGVESDVSFDARVRDALGISPVHGHVVVSPYDAFPYGLTLDYERKFAYYTPGLSPVAI